MMQARKRGTQEWEQLEARTDGFYNQENKKVADIGGELNYYGKQKYVDGEFNYPDGDDNLERRR